MKKTLQFITRLTAALFFTVLIYFTLNQNPIFKINLGLEINYPLFLTLFFLAVVSNISNFVYKNRLKISQIPFELYSLIKTTAQTIANFFKTLFNSLPQIFYKLYQNLAIKWGLVPICFLIVGAGLFIYSALTTGDAFSVIVNNHKNEIRVENSASKVEFAAKENNLGIVSIPLELEEINEEIVTKINDTEVEEDIVEEEGEEKEQEQRIDIERLVVFRLKEKGRWDWIYEKEYDIKTFQNKDYVHFGFPIIEESHGKEFIVEIESIAFEDENLTISDQTPQFITKYKFNRQEITATPQSFIAYIAKKSFNTAENYPVTLAITVFLLPVFYLFSRIYYEKTKPDEHFFNLFTKNLFLILLLLIAIASFTFFLFGALSVAQIDTFIFKIFNKSFIYPTILVGFITFYKNRAILIFFKESKKSNVLQLENNGFLFSKLFFKIITISLFLLNILIRLWKIGEISFYYDELIQIYAAKGISDIGLPYFPSGISYYRGWVSSYVICFTQFLTKSNSEQVLRIPFVFIMVSAIFLLFIFTKKYLNKKIAFIFLIIISLNTQNIIISQQLRFYGLLILFLSLAMLILNSKIKFGKKVFITAFLAGISIYDFPPMFIIYAVLLGLNLIWGEKRINIKKLLYVSPILLLMGLYVLYRFIHFHLKDVISVSLISFSNYYLVLFKPITLILAALSVLNWKNRKLLPLIIGSFAYLLGLSLLTSEHFPKTPRYITPVYPIILLLASIGVYNIYNFLSSTILKGKEVLSILVSMLIIIGINNSTIDYFINKDGHLRYKTYFTWTRPAYKIWKEIQIPKKAIVISNVPHIAKFYTERLDYAVLINHDREYSRIIGAKNINNIDFLLDEHRCIYAFVDYKTYRWESIKPIIESSKFRLIKEGRYVWVYKSIFCD